MAKSVYTHLDFHSVSQLKNALLDVRSTIPTGVAGQILYNASTGKFGYYNGTSWVYPNEYSLPTATASVLGGIKVGSTLAISNGVLNQKSGITTAGTYRSVIVDTYGRVTAGTNPTTLTGYGITDANISNGVITLGSVTITPATTAMLGNAVPSVTTANKMLLSTTTGGTSKWSDSTWTGNSQGILQTTAEGVISRVSPTIWGVTFNGGNVTGVPNLYIGTTKVQTSSTAQHVTGVSSLTIGDAVLSYDSTTHALKLEKRSGTTTDIGFWAEGFVSAFGPSATEGGGTDITAEDIISILNAYTPGEKIKGEVLDVTGGGGGLSWTDLENATSTSHIIDSSHLPTNITALPSKVTSVEGTLNSSRSAHYVYAAPSSGTGAPSWRALVASDIPTLAKSKISDFPTSMPASDVYAWAKAANKPSYTWNEIGSRPTNLSQFTDDVVSGHYLPVDGKAADSDKLDGYHFGYGNSHEASSNYIKAKFSRILNLSSLSTSNFYPVTVQIGSRSTWECRIHSQSSSSSAAYNQNWIDFELNGKGWYDSPQGLFVKGYGAYDSNEICIGSIGMGADDGLGVIWLRGGLTYYCESNFVLTEHSANYSNGDEVYSVGTGFSGGTNARVNVWFTPGVQFPVPAMQFSSGMLRGGFYFQKEVKAEGGFIGNLTGRATEADHADAATNSDKLDGLHAADLGRGHSDFVIAAAAASTAAYAGWYTLFTLPDMSANANSGVHRITLVQRSLSTGYGQPWAVDITIYTSLYNQIVIKVEGGTSGLVNAFRYCSDTREFQVYNYRGYTVAQQYTIYYNQVNQFDGARGTNITPASGTVAKDTSTHTGVTSIPWTGGFYITGDVYSAGNLIGYYSSSDMRLKKNFADLNLGLEDVASLPLLSYDRTDRNNRRTDGTIAQEVQKLLPNEVYDRGDGYLAMAEGQLGLIFGINAHKEILRLRKRVEELERRLN